MKCFTIADVVLRTSFLYFKFLGVKKEVFFEEDEFFNKWGCIDYFLSKYLDSNLYKLISSLVNLNFLSWDFHSLDTTLLRDDDLGCIHRVNGSLNGTYFIDFEEKIDDCFYFSSCPDCFTKVSVFGGVDNYIDDADFWFYFTLEACYNDCTSRFNVLNKINKIKNILGG